MSDFAQKLMKWQMEHGRHDLPWQQRQEAYPVWVSEIMLQQTQVDTVIPYYQRFMARFPDLATLAAAELAEVLALWSGLGYYARARNLHACARQVVAELGGEFPRTPEAIALLPGIGRSTAAAIACFAFGARAAILDGNVKRVLCRVFGIEGFPGQAAVETQLWSLAESLLPEHEPARYIQAQMDLGATLCTRRRPDCARCPLSADCVAQRENRTEMLPSPRPKKARPERSALVLVLREDQRVLLELRPPAGIWGGLLALPELTLGSSEAAARWAFDSMGLQVLASQNLPPLRHAFTHFTLDLHPLLLDVISSPAAAREPGWAWLALDQLSEAPLPTPVRRILQALPAPAGVSPAAAIDAASGIAR